MSISRKEAIKTSTRKKGGRGTHGSLFTCRLCAKEFRNRSLLDKHKIKKHEYTPQKLGWLVAGWNKGILMLNNSGNKHPVGQFTSEIRNSKTFREKYTLGRERHKEEISKKVKQLKGKGYRVLITSLDSKPKKIPDIIAISLNGKVIAFELESVRPFKASIDTYRKRYTKILHSLEFFDEVIVEPYIMEE